MSEQHYRNQAYRLQCNDCDFTDTLGTQQDALKEGDEHVTDTGHDVFLWEVTTMGK